MKDSRWLNIKKIYILLINSFKAADVDKNLKSKFH